MDRAPEDTAPHPRVEALEAENAKLRAALAAAGLDASEARTATAAAEDATRLSQADAATAAAGHARDMAAGRAELADATALNAQLQELNAELRASEERLDAVIESATDHAIIQMDFDGRITGWSPGAERVLGWTAAEAIGEDGAIIWTPEDRAAGVPERERKLADATGSSGEDRWHIRRDGTRIWGSGHLTPLRNGRPRGYLKVLRDRTAERHAQEALRLAAARDAYRVALTDALRGAADAVEAQQAAMRVLGDQLGAVRVMFGEADPGSAESFTNHHEYRRNLAMPTSLGKHRWDDFGSYVAEEMRAGRTLVVDDVRTHPGHSAGDLAAYEVVGIRAYLAVPLVRKGRIVAYLAVNHTAPHAWTAEEVALVEETAERTWATVERARVEAELRESEGRFRQFAETTSDIIWIRNAETLLFEYVSPAFEVIYGEGLAELLAVNDFERWAEIIHPEDRERTLASIARVQRGERVTHEFRICRGSDGEVRWIRDTDFPLLDERGGVRQVAGIGQDITELRRVQDALVEGEGRLRTLMEGIPQLVWRSAVGGEWTWASPQWTAFTGLSEEASRGWGWLAAVHPDDREGVMAAWDRAGAEGAFETDCRLRQADEGQWRWFWTRGLPVRGAPEPGFPAGRVIEWLGTSTDMDDAVRAREALTQSTEELEARVRERTAELMAAEESLRQSQKMEAIGQLTGGIAHDFNNMLQGVVGGLDMARRRLEEGRSGDTARYMTAARDAAGRAAGLTRRLLAFARRQRLEPQPVDADALVSGMAELLRRTVGPAITLDLILCDGTWPVLCDPNELESAILNLCINARDAMPDGGRLTIATGEVHLSAAELRRVDDPPPGDYVGIRVVDTGTGMPPEILDRVLEPFFTTKPLGQGTGLGLSQVYGFARQSGGLLRIESTLGRGTAVHILLPRGEAELARMDETEEAAREADSVAGGTVLIVDDEAAVRVPAGERLRDLGYRVIEAPDGPAALRLLDEGLRPDLLVTDVGLPNGMDGRVVAEAARGRLPGLPVLFITGYARVALPEDAEVITKPFDLEALSARIRATLKV